MRTPAAGALPEGARDLDQRLDLRRQATSGTVRKGNACLARRDHLSIVDRSPRRPEGSRRRRGSSRASAARKARSAGRNEGRSACRPSTASWWRQTSNSTSLANSLPRRPTSNRNTTKREVGKKAPFPILSWRRRRPPARWNPGFETLGRRARRSSACRSSASSPHTRRSTRITLRIPSRATRSRRCSRRSSAGSCTGGPARRTSRSGSRTSWSPTTTTGFRPIGTTQACGAGICGATSTRATSPRAAGSHSKPTSAPSTSSSPRPTPS